MQTVFNLDGHYAIRITSDQPRHASDRGSIGFQLERTPLRLPGDPEPTDDQCWSSSDQPVPKGTQIMMSKNLRPSEARAIASMLLSAATEGR